MPGAQVRQEQGADVGVLRYGHGAPASGTRCVPNRGPCRLSKITGTWGKENINPSVIKRGNFSAPPFVFVVFLLTFLCFNGCCRCTFST